MLPFCPDEVNAVPTATETGCSAAGIIPGIAVKSEVVKMEVLTLYCGGNRL